MKLSKRLFSQWKTNKRAPNSKAEERSKKKKEDGAAQPYFTSTWWLLSFWFCFAEECTWMNANEFVWIMSTSRWRALFHSVDLNVITWEFRPSCIAFVATNRTIPAITMHKSIMGLRAQNENPPTETNTKKIVCQMWTPSYNTIR